MGNAFVAVVGNTSNIYFNPAGLSSCQVPEMSVDYSSQEFDQTSGSVEGAYPFRSAESVGVSVQYQTVDDIDLRSGEFESPSNTSSNESRLSMAYAKGWGPLSLGVSLKSLTHSFSGLADKGHGFALDLGTNYSWNHLVLGVALQNIAGRYRWSTGRMESFPLIVRTGASYPVFPWLLTAIDIEMLDGQTPLVHGGLEARYREALLRAGINEDHPTLGMGFGFQPLNKLRLRFDYGLELDPAGLNDVHRFGLSAFFL
jgi:hypothetical protein